MENVMNQVEQVEVVNSSEATTERRHPASLGKLNRMTRVAAKALAENGHAAKRFKRDYTTGVATYVCPDCSATALAIASVESGKSKVEGSALTLKCSVVNS